MIRQHTLGVKILSLLLRRQGTGATEQVLGPLLGRLQGSRGCPQYSVALARVLRECAAIVMESHTVLSPLVDSLCLMEHSSGKRALMPMARLSRRLLDSLIFSLRKSLFSRRLGARLTAVSGVLQLLRTFRFCSFCVVSLNYFIVLLRL